MSLDVISGEAQSASKAATGSYGEEEGSVKIPSYGTTSDAAWERNRDRLYDYATDNDIRAAIKQAFLVGFDNGARHTVNTLIEWRGSTDRDDDGSAA